MQLEGLAENDPRRRRPDLDRYQRWYQDRGVIGTALWMFGFAAVVFGALFLDQLYWFVQGIDLENRYGRCGPDAAENCVTVTAVKVVSVSGGDLVLDDSGTRLTVTGTSGVPASTFHAGQTVETVSAGGPVAEVKANGQLLFTRYYKPEDPIYWQWQGAVFGVLGTIWLVLYVWGVGRAGIRSPVAVLRRE